MAGTVTKTEVTATSVKKIRWSWTSDGDGDATSTTTAYFSGRILAFLTDPDGTAAPSPNYDVTITDGDGDDVLLGQGANRDTANTEYVTEANLGAVSSSKLTLTVANAGNSKKGVVALWLR